MQASMQTMQELLRKEMHRINHRILPNVPATPLHKMCLTHLLSYYNGSRRRSYPKSQDKYLDAISPYTPHNFTFVHILTRNDVTDAWLQKIFYLGESEYHDNPDYSYWMCASHNAVHYAIVDYVSTIPDVAVAFLTRPNT
jgi:hypothetical protein